VTRSVLAVFVYICLQKPLFVLSFFRRAAPPVLVISRSVISFIKNPAVRMIHGVLQLATLLTFRLVSASLYPIQPVQNTVYYSGQTALTRWIDDGTYPVLSEMGGISIQLYRDSDVRFLPPLRYFVVERKGLH